MAAFSARQIIRGKSRRWIVRAALVEEGQHGWTEGHWLRHCTGFRVEGPGGRLGYVDQVLLDPEGSAPVALVVRGRRATVVSVGEIVRFLPTRELVLVGETRPELESRRLLAKAGR
jgi:hypothetical protein